VSTEQRETVLITREADIADNSRKAIDSPVGWVALAVELRARLGSRRDTVADVIEIVLTERLLWE
jgi:hypothetical protein